MLEKSKNLMLFCILSLQDLRHEEQYVNVKTRQDFPPFIMSIHKK